MADPQNPKKPKAYSYVRMSTEGQLRGDSLRRQVERSKQYAATHGLDLDETVSFNDIGVSAFRGKNLKHGALSHFIEAVRTEKIARGSYLLVESLDRFSRDEVVHAQSEFLQLIKSGINVVTLIDGRVFRPDHLDMTDLIVSLVTLARANDESKHKSDRLSQAWANKRAHAGQRKMTAMCPGWLRLSADRTKFEVIEERAAIVRRIFEDSASGIGNYKITQRLNKAGVSPFTQLTKTGRRYKRQAEGWHNTYIAKIMNNPAVYGEFQPHKRDAKGRSVADGPPIENYYPKIVDKELFLRAKQGRIARDFRDQFAAKGRKGEHLSNLFSGLAKCAYCGATMRLENRGAGPKGGTFLACDGKRRGMACPNVRWRYDDFEASFLFFVKELDLESLLSRPTRQEEIGVTIQVLQGRLAILREQQEKTYQLFIEDMPPGSFVGRKLAEIDQQIKDIEAEVERATAAQAAAKAEAGRFTESKGEIKPLIDRLQNTTDEETFKLRSRVADSLRSIVKSLRIAGAGARYLPRPPERKGVRRVTYEEVVRAMFTAPGEEGLADKILAQPRSARVDQSGWRFFEVTLKDGSRRVIKPGVKDPLFLRGQTAIGLAGSDGVELWQSQAEH